MSIVWELDLPPGEKLVLLALADQANDQGLQCWPSIPTIAHRSGQGERTVHRVIASLEKKRHLTRNLRTGLSTQYHVHPCQNGTPAKMAPLPNATLTPAKMAPHPCQNGTLTINEPLETSIDAKASKRAREHKPQIIIPDWIPKAAWDGWTEMRKLKHSAPSPRALELAIGVLEKLRAKGHDPGEVLDQSTLNGWKGLFPIKDTQNGHARQSNLQYKPSAALALYKSSFEGDEADSGHDWPALPASIGH
jgi:hypothetical protein